MKIRTITLLTMSCLALALPACSNVSSIKLWPFGNDGKSPERSRTPANSTEYQCGGNKRFYVRTLDGGNAAWVILPDREVRLDKTSAAGGERYSNGKLSLEINAGEASLNDGSVAVYTACKTPAAVTPGSDKP